LEAGGQAGPLIESIGDGYVLRLGPAVLDLDTFERWLSEAGAARLRGDTARGARLLRDALGLWRGDALAGVPGPYADTRRVPLTELHMGATEEKLAADIWLGDLAGAIAELRGLLADHPFREGLSELLMLALYKSGRQAEALDVFGSVRQRLGDELGIDPGHPCRRCISASCGPTSACLTGPTRWARSWSPDPARSAETARQAGAARPGSLPGPAG
jgi:DNA-binding SARP family transcriptional activator